MLKNEKGIFDIASDAEFTGWALRIFQYQYKNNAVYRQWSDLLKVNPGKVQSLGQVPFLPIEFFKSHTIISGDTGSPVIFTSSGTTSSVPARHYVSDTGIYEQSFRKCFELFYGDVRDYCVLALLPSYLERGGSSLVYMCNDLIKKSGHALSGFYLHNVEELEEVIVKLRKQRQKTLLIGVSYALLDLAGRGTELDNCFIVMETGGMKGTRKEMLKDELHHHLKKGFKVNAIHSEYGMTELLSQAYSRGEGRFFSPPWMKFLIREVDDPLKLRDDSRTGGINVIDLANINSCSFIATKDLGKINESGELELMGRYDQSDVRGCNLMLGGF